MNQTLNRRIPSKAKKLRPLLSCILSLVFSFVIAPLSITLTLTAATPAHAQTSVSCEHVFQISTTQLTQSSSLRLVSATDPVLRRQAAYVETSRIQTPEFQSTLNSMLELIRRHRSVGLSAPRAGLSERIIVAKLTKKFLPNFNRKDGYVVMINPRVTEVDGVRSYRIERCLSLPLQCGFVARSRKIAVDFTDQNGIAQTVVLSGSSARTIQKEVDSLNGVQPNDRAIGLIDYLKGRTARTDREEDLIMGAFNQMRATSDPARWSTWRKWAQEVSEDIHNPYSIAYDLREQSARAGRDVTTEVSSLLGILVSEPEATKAQKLSDWTQSEPHALLLYDLLNQTGIANHARTIEYLLTNNLYFSDANPIRGPPLANKGSLVTFSFEKEGSQSSITQLYRPANISEQRWFAESNEFRIEEIRDLPGRRKQFMPIDIVAPTAQKPSFLGGYSRETTEDTREGWGWEVAHKAYEISLPRIMQQVRRVASFFRETHSFHFHISFDLPKRYLRDASFIRWFKHLNDYLYLRGLEEGLHGNYLTNVMNLREDLGMLERDPEKEGTRSLMTNSTDDVSKTEMKFFSAGFRSGGMYGPAANGEMKRVGIELRDTTRNLDHLNQYATELTGAVSEYRWERLAATAIAHAQTQTPRLTTIRSVTLRQLTRSLDQEFAQRFYGIEKTVGLPLAQYESGQYFNFRSGAFESPAPEVVARLVRAREMYIRSLTNLQAEIRAMRAAGTTVEDGDIHTALKMSLNEWARAARASELYRHF